VKLKVWRRLSVGQEYAFKDKNTRRAENKLQEWGHRDAADLLGKAAITFKLAGKNPALLALAPAPAHAWSAPLP